MGKTKTAVISGAPEDALSGKEKYKLKQKKKADSEAAEKSKKLIKGVGLKGGERVATVAGGPVLEEKKAPEKSKKKVISTGPRKRSSKYQDALGKIDKSKLYGVKDAVKLIKDTSYSSFDGTVEFHATVKKQGTSFRVTLPFAGGKKKKVELADDKTLAKLKDGKVDFDVLLATTDMMPKLVPFAKVLGPKGLMPNPKNGTLLKSASDAKKFSTDTITIKTEKENPLIHVAVGKVSQKQSELEKNIEAVVKALGPKQVIKANLSATMSPSVKLIIQ